MDIKHPEYEASQADEFELLDLRGSRLARIDVGALGTGTHMIDFAAGRTLEPGLYFIRLQQSGANKTMRVAFLR